MRIRMKRHLSLAVVHISYLISHISYHCPQPQSSINPHLPSNITVLSTAKCPVSAFLGCPVTPRICGVTVAWELIHSLLRNTSTSPYVELGKGIHRILACLDYQTLLVQQCCTFSRQVRCPRILLLSTNTDFLQWKLGEHASLTAFNALYSPPHPSDILPAPVYQVACDS